MADAAWLQATRRTCEEHRVLFVADEIQSFCRTGTVFFCEQLGVVPDIIALAKAAVLGITLAREDAGQTTKLDVSQSDVQLSSRKLVLVTNAAQIGTAYDRLKNDLDIHLEEHSTL